MDSITNFDFGGLFSRLLSVEQTDLHSALADAIHEAYAEWPALSKHYPEYDAQQLISAVPDYVLRDSLQSFFTEDGDEEAEAVSAVRSLHPGFLEVYEKNPNPEKVVAVVKSIKSIVGFNH